MELTRRKFLLGSAAAVGSAALAGAMSGCSPEGGSSEATEEEAAEVGTETEGAVEEFAEIVPIDPVEAPAEWDGEYDIIVVGGGGAGLTAAARSIYNGKNVLLLEKTEALGGACRYSTGAGAYGTKVQKENTGFDISDPETYEWIRQRLDWYQDEKIDWRIADLVIRKAAEAIDWLGDEVGIEWIAPTTDIEDPHEFKFHLPKTEKRHIGTMGVAIDQIIAYCEEKGVDIKMNTGAEALVKDGDAVVGVFTRAADGTEAYYKGKVILAGGGMGSNRDMLHKYIPTAIDLVGATYDMYGDGQCILMGLGAGADINGYDSFDTMGEIPCFHEEGTGLWYHFLYNGDAAIVRQPWLHVNGNARRFARFVALDVFDRGRRLTGPQSNCCYVIFDDDYKDKIWLFGERGCRMPVTPEDAFIDEYTDVLDSTDWTVTAQKAIDNGTIKKADTIEELAGLLGLDSEALTASVDEWNDCCEKGEDPLFNTPDTFLVPIDKAPFYGTKVKMFMCSTDCGLYVDENLRVYDTEGNYIEGLYAASHTAGGFSGNRNHGRGSSLKNVGLMYATGLVAADTASQ